jgi:hypothetical protein
MIRRRLFKIAQRFVAVLACLALVAGCNRKAALAADPAPFRDAVHAYLADKSMDMKVAEFRTLTTAGDRAEADIALEQAEGAAGWKVRWHFWFERQGGRWAVTRHQQ